MSNIKSTTVHEMCNGFSLLELLSAMAILMIIIMMMGVIIAEGERIWTIGTNRVDNNSYGRAALNMIAHDLQYAVADNVLTFVMCNDPRGSAASYGFQNSEICAVSLQNNSEDGNRTAREIYYYVEQMTNSLSANTGIGRYYLVRGYWGAEITDTNLAAKHCYKNPGWYYTAGRPTNSAVIADNVSAFSVSCAGNFSYYRSSDYGNRLPEYVDVCLEIVNERPARQAGELWLKWVNHGDATARDRAKDIVEKNQRRYTERVYFHNRYGYKVR